MALEYASPELQADREVALAAVREDGLALEYASPELQADKEVVLEAIRQDGWLLEYASEELRGDREVVLEAVRQNVRALKYASEELKGDKEVALEAIRQDGWLLEYASEELRGDREVALEVVRGQKEKLIEVIKSMITQSDILAFASDELKENPTFISEVLGVVFGEKQSLSHDSSAIAETIQPTQSEINGVMREIVYAKEADKETQKGDATSQNTESEGR